MDLISQTCASLLQDALTGELDNKFITSEECKCLTSISLKEFEAASGIDPQSCGFSRYATVADNVAYCIGKLGQNYRTRDIQATLNLSSNNIFNYY